MSGRLSTIALAIVGLALACVTPPPPPATLPMDGNSALIGIKVTLDCVTRQQDSDSKAL